MLATILLILIGYFLGSINSAILISRVLGLPDPRTQGSGNPGTTNVLRTGGKVPATIVLLLDVLKGAIPVLVARLLGLSDVVIGLVALAAVLGHVFPIYFKFAGGKGVATQLGILFAMHWALGVTFVVIWLLVALTTRYSSLAALIATVLMPIAALLFASNGYIAPLMVIALLIIYRHRGNITRLLDGSESKIGKKKST